MSTQMYLVSNEELNTLVRRRRLDVLTWVREELEQQGGERDSESGMQLVAEVLNYIEAQVRQASIGYDYQERDESPISEDEFAALEEDDGEDDTAVDFALAHAGEDDTMRLLDVASDEAAVEVTEVGEDEASTVEGVHVGPYPEFPSQHTEVAQYTAEVEEVKEVAAPEPVAPTMSDEERNKRNAARQRVLNREIAQIDSDR